MSCYQLHQLANGAIFFEMGESQSCVELTLCLYGGRLSSGDLAAQFLGKNNRRPHHSRGEKPPAGNGLVPIFHAYPGRRADKHRRIITAAPQFPHHHRSK